jgi:hypothetical protein
MTTYRHDISLNDSETIMLEEALKLMIKECDNKIAQGHHAPFHAHKNSAEKVLSRLYDNQTQTSGNNFHLKGNTPEIFIKTRK